MQDIKRRKQLSMASFNQYKHMLTSKKIPLRTRMRLVKTYITSTFMYNSELWTLRKELEKEIDVFQRKMLRSIVQIKWPYKISNKELYKRTKQKRWSERIKIRSIKWLGHLIRQPEKSPAKLALRESLRPIRRPRGKPKTTWIAMINNDLKHVNLKLGTAEIEEAARDRESLRAITRKIEGAMSTNEE